MMVKKPGWRRGVVVSREGKPDRPARARDADKFLDLALSESDPKRKQEHLLSAQIARSLGRWNEAHGFHKHTGRPKGSTGEAKYGEALNAMGEIAAATGGDTPRALAKQAVAAGHAPKDVQPESAIQQLVILWERAVKKN